MAKRIDALVSDLPSQDEEIAKLMVQRRDGYDPATASAEGGEKVFSDTCAACHQFAGKGTVVGPQLDGIGARGVERLVEDLLDPNRNVDVAFRTSTWILNDGRVVAGLQRREEGGTIVVADSAGKEAAIAKGEVLNRSDSALSLMPENIAVDLTPQQFNDLLRYLTTEPVPAAK